MPNLDLQAPQEVSTFRKIALGTWQTAYDPSVYGTMEVPMDAAMDYLARYRERTGRRLTVTHMAGKALAAALRRMPAANAVLRFNRPYQRKSVGIFFQVALAEDEGDIDLSGLVIHDLDRLSLSEIIDAFEAQVEKVRTRSDPVLEKTRSSFKHIPFMLMNAVMKLISFLCFTLNLDLRWAGLPKDPFGSVMLTNIGSLGLDQAYAPLVPYAKVPMVLALGAVREVPVVRDGAIVVAKQLSLSATFDHRLLDGVHAAIMAREVRKWFGDPDQYFGPIPAAGGDGADA